MRRQLEERSESAWCLVRKLRVLLIIVKELARALWLEPLCRVHVVYRFQKELGMTSRTPVVGHCLDSVCEFGTVQGRHYIHLSSEEFKKVDQILQIQKDAAVVCKALHLYLLP